MHHVRHSRREFSLSLSQICQFVCVYVRVRVTDSVTVENRL